MKQFIEQNKENILNDLKELVSFNSEFSDDEKPFGKENKKILDKAIQLMNDKGFKTTNLDYYCGYGDIGEGDKTIGIVCHLDIVPAGADWLTDPFKLTIKDGYAYGRGVSDDKGAAVASMWAMKYLLDTGYKFKKTCRLILGCNEETGSLCVKHYVKEKGHIDLGFTPDGNFPGIYAEKGMLNGFLIGHNSKIIDIKGGDAANIVPKRVEATLPSNSYDQNKFKTYLDSKGIKYEINGDKVTVFGVAAHASTPDLGKNAIMYLVEALYNSDFNDSYIDYLHKYFGLENHGETLGFESLKDSESNTSINLGVISKEGNDIKLTLDMRFPVKTTSDKCKKLLDVLHQKDNDIDINYTHEPLYFDVNSPFIKALDKAYRTATGDNETKMECIGGGTYAKSINNCIAFGCEFPGDDNHIHDANEKLKVEDLYKQIEIYVEAIKNLNELD